MLGTQKAVICFYCGLEGYDRLDMEKDSIGDPKYIDETAKIINQVLLGQPICKACSTKLQDEFKILISK